MARLQRAKVHRYSLKYGPENTACGWSLSVVNALAIPDAAFVWLPIERQCMVCRKAYRLAHAPHGINGSELTLTSVECFVLELGRLGQYARDVPHAERGCYHRVTLLGDGPAIQRCWCGKLWVDSQGMLGGAECRTVEESAIRARYAPP